MTREASVRASERFVDASMRITQAMLSEAAEAHRSTDFPEANPLNQSWEVWFLPHPESNLLFPECWYHGDEDSAKLRQAKWNVQVAGAFRLVKAPDRRTCAS